MKTVFSFMPGLTACLLWVSVASADPIHDAAKAGDIEALRSLIESGVSVESESPLGTPLAVAARAGHADAVAFLVEVGADPNVTSVLGPPLLSAVRKDEIEIVGMLLAAGADPNAGKRSIPIVDAVKRGNLEIVLLLLKAGADPNAPPDSDRVLALHEAARRGDTTLVKALLEAGADPNEFTTRRETAFHMALQLEKAETAALLENLTNPVLDTSITEEMVAAADAAIGRELFDDHCG
ncbi:MAG: ankyrin repeat domain-containing protein, partial [Rhizobiaceae bacterium]